MREEALNILIREQGGKFKLDEAALEEVLGDRDELAVVISVAGPFRKGKSFLLDYMLRFLESGLKDLGNEDEPLRGFSWRGGSERDTTGLLLWSKVFPIELPDGRKLGVLLLDTQGAFDSQSTVRESAVVFALSTLLSSVQIYNLSQNIQEDDLHHLQFFAEYGRVAANHTSSYPFQRLIFLVRDWAYSYEAAYGWEGGSKIVNRRLSTSEDQHHELRDIRKHIYNCFLDVQGYLMPYPGHKVAAEASFDGRLTDLDSKFREYLFQFINYTLSPDNLLVKSINKQELRVKDLRHYFKSYVEVFSGDTIPEPRSIYTATAEANHLTAVATAKDLYVKKMKNICGSSKVYMDPKKLEKEHEAIKQAVMKDFRQKPKMGGGNSVLESYALTLENSIDEMYSNFKQLNEAKTSFMNFLTPGLFIGFAIFFYILSGVLALVGLYTMSNWCNLLAGVYLVGAATWAYVKWTGELQHLGRWIDAIAFFLWQHIVLPTYQASLFQPCC